MQPRDGQDLLTRVGPGTPCGTLMRRYWQPAALSEELPPGGAPLPIRLLGEHLVLFRDEQGRPGLLGIHCSHRGAELTYGRLEDGGLRCIYHGWLYDIHGSCLEQPGEPAGSRFHERIHHLAYPCEERAGVIFAYLGPGEPPLFPRYEFLHVPDDYVVATKLLHECNYLQANEGNIDLSHLSFLHYSSRNRGIGGGLNNQGARPELSAQEYIVGRGAAPAVEMADAERTPYGIRSYKIRRDFGPEHYQLYLTEFVLPNLTAFPGASRGVGGYGVNWHVPIDDTSHWKYTLVFCRDHPIDEAWLNNPQSRTEGYRPFRNKANRYLQDRQSMKTECYAGIGFDFVFHDLCAPEGQGPIQDRSSEHLGAMDLALVIERSVMVKAIVDLEAGIEPANVVRSAERNEFRIIANNGVYSESKPWKEVARDLEGEVRL